MPTELRYCDTFKSFFKDLIGKFVRSESDLREDITAMRDRPRDGDRLQGFSGVELRKVRLPLKAYQLSPRRGARHINLYMAEQLLLYPVLIYKKGEIKNESKILSMIRKALYNTLSDIKAKRFSADL